MRFSCNLPNDAPLAELWEMWKEPLNTPEACLQRGLKT